MANVNELFPGQLELQEMIERTKRAQLIYANYPQEKVDEIFRAAAIAANNARIQLAIDAVEETGMGIIEDKVIKNHFAAEYIFHKYKDEKTCGIIESDKAFGIEKIAEPKGVICGIIPTTNPTSTAIFKSLIALKTRNAIIFSPHPRAKKCTCDAARLVRDAAVAAGAPEDIIGFIEEPSMDKTNYLMHNPLVNLILATGGPGMVKSAYSSGKPAIGVGAGNTPALMDKNCNIKMAVASILMSKTFDNGVVCASEQCVIVHKDIYSEVKKEFKEQGAHFLSKEELTLLEPIILDPERGSVNPKIVGQPAYKIAEIAGFKVPEYYTSRIVRLMVTLTTLSGGITYLFQSGAMAWQVLWGAVLVSLGGFAGFPLGTRMHTIAFNAGYAQHIHKSFAIPAGAMFLNTMLNVTGCREASRIAMVVIAFGVAAGLALFTRYAARHRKGETVS